MKTAALMACKGFLERCPANMQEQLIRLLPKQDQLDLSELPHLMPLNTASLEWNLLDYLHFSWIAPYLRTFTEHENRLFLAALSKEQMHGLEKALGMSDHLPLLTRFSKSSLRSLLFQMVTQNQPLVPYPFLPDHPLNHLLQIKHVALDKIACFLGLHDLSFEMRQIISTAELKKIFASLPKKQGEYLNTLLLHREPLVFKRLFLDKWDGSKEQLAKLIEERGLHRFSLALYGAHPSLIWYITRRFSMHLGNSMLKYNEKPTHARAEQILVDQINKILTFLKLEESA